MLKDKLFHRQIEPWVLVGCLFVVTALYYTRQNLWQILAFLIMAGGILYWNISIRQGNLINADTLKLRKKKLWLQILLALALSIFGWYYFDYYVQLTRGRELEWGFGGSYAAVFMIIAVSVAEEIFFRGYLQNKFNPRYKMLTRVLLAVCLMALYKNAVHMWEGWHWALHAELFFVGVLHNILPSLWMEWSDNLAGPLLLHVFWDLLVYAPMEGIPYWVF